jgi:hypothetical protein
MASTLLYEGLPLSVFDRSDATCETIMAKTSTIVSFVSVGDDHSTDERNSSAFFDCIALVTCTQDNSCLM